MTIPDGAEDRPEGAIPGRPGERIGYATGDVLLLIAATGMILLSLAIVLGLLAVLLAPVLFQGGG